MCIDAALSTADSEPLRYTVVVAKKTHTNAACGSTHSVLLSIFLAVFDGFKLDRHRVHHVDDRLYLKFEHRKDAREIMNVGWGPLSRRSYSRSRA
jgi:hypothetical protein